MVVVVVVLSIFVPRLTHIYLKLDGIISARQTGSSLSTCFYVFSRFSMVAMTAFIRRLIYPDVMLYYLCHAI